MNIRPMGDELFHEDRETDERTDMTELIVAFLQFCESALKYNNVLTVPDYHNKKQTGVTFRTSLPSTFGKQYDRLHPG